MELLFLPLPHPSLAFQANVLRCLENTTSKARLARLAKQTL